MRLIRLAAPAAATALALIMAPAAMAQTTFSDAGGSFLAHVQTVCPALAASRSANPANLSSTEQDLFLRCNGALSQPTSGISGLTPQANLLDQYFGVQSVAAQSDTVSHSNRPTQAVAGRINAMAGQMKGGQTASYAPSRPIMVASLDQAVDLSGGVRESRLSGFFSVGGFQGDQETTNRELGFEEDGLWAAAGVDYQFTDQFGAGLAVSYVDASADFDAIGGNASGGSLDTESWAVTAYGVFAPTAAISLTGLVATGSTDFASVRSIDVIDRNGVPTSGGGQNAPAAVVRSALGDTSGDFVQASLTATYDAVSGATTFSPFVGVDFYDAEIDGYSETGAAGLNLAFESQNVESLRLNVGATVTHAFSQSWGVLAPFATIQGNFETQDDAQQVRARYIAAGRVTPASTFVITTNSADDLSVDLSVGLSMQWAGGASGFAKIGALVGQDDVSYQHISAGFRMTF